MSKGNLSKIDNLGRVVIPKSIRKALNIERKRKWDKWKFKRRCKNNNINIRGRTFLTLKDFLYRLITTYKINPRKI